VPAGIFMNPFGMGEGGQRCQGEERGEGRVSTRSQQVVGRAGEKAMWFNKDTHKVMVLGRNKWRTSWVRNCW